jgi:hypothetical protein
LQLWKQATRKIDFAHAPLVNHWSIIPYATSGFSIDFDFIDHAPIIQTSDGAIDRLLPTIRNWDSSSCRTRP